MNTQNGMSQQSMTGVKQSARRLRKQFLTYEDAEIIYRLSGDVFYAWVDLFKDVEIKGISVTPVVIN